MRGSLRRAAGFFGCGSGAAAAVRDLRIVNHFSGVLVLAQALERGLAQNGVRGPSREFDLGDEARLDPMHALCARPLSARRRSASGRARALEPLVQLDQLRRVEPGADAAGIAQSSLRVIIADEQRAEALPAAVRDR